MRSLRIISIVLGFLVVVAIRPEARGDSFVSPVAVATGAVTKGALKGLRDTGNDLIQRAEAAGGEVAARVGAELRAVVGDLDVAIDRFDAIQGKLTDAMLRTVAKATILVREGELALRSLIVCTRQEVDSLLKTMDVSLTSVAASSIPWNHHWGYIANSYDARNAHQRGLRAGHPGTFVFEGAFIGFDGACGVTEAKLHRLPDGASLPLKVDYADARKVGVEIPALTQPGLYQVDVGYLASGGLLGRCEKQRRVVSTYIPVENMIVYSLAYKLRPKCDGETRADRTVQVYVGNDDCDNGKSSEDYINLSNPAVCHFENVSQPECFNGGGSPSVGNEATRLALHVSVGKAWCRVFDKRGVSAGYRLHATEVCKTTGTLGPETTGTSGALQAGQSTSSHVAIDPSTPPLPGLQRAQECTWLWQASLVRRQGEASDVFDFPPGEGKGGLELIDSHINVRATWSPATATVTTQIREGSSCEAFQ